MSELLIVYNYRHIPHRAIGRLAERLSNNRSPLKVHAISTRDYSAPDLRIFDLDKLPDAEAKEVVRIVKGVVAE